MNAQLTRNAGRMTVFPTKEHAGAFLRRTDIYRLFIDSQTKPQISERHNGGWCLAAINPHGKVHGFLQVPGV